MKSIFTIAALLPALLLVAPMGVESQVFHSVRGLLASHFQSSDRVTYEKVRPEGAARKRIERRLGRRLPRSEYTFYVAKTDGQVDGYALFDREVGQSEPIDFALFFDPRGKVRRVEVVAYREPYGDGIRSERFRRQFVGRDADSGFRAGKEIDIISGATLSSRAMARAVHRGAVLLEETMLKDEEALAHR